MELALLQSEEVCANCMKYMQHYVCIDGEYFRPCNCGHCIYPRIKARKPLDTCEHFERRGTV